MVLLLDRQRAPVEVLVVVGEHVQQPLVRVRVEREQRRPPPRAEVLRLVDDDGVVPRTEPLGSLGERLGQPVLEVRALGPCGVVGRERDPRLLRHPNAELVEVGDVDPADVPDGVAQVLSEPSVETREERPVSGRRESLRERDREQGLAAPGRAGNGRPAAMGHERQDPGLVRGELDELLVLLVEPQPEGRPDLDVEPEGKRDRIHAARAEPAPPSLPGAHDLGDALRQPGEVVAVDHDVRRRAGVRVSIVDPVGERRAVPVARAPLGPARLRLQDALERAHRVARLVERVLVETVRTRVPGLRPRPRRGS